MRDIEFGVIVLVHREVVHNGVDIVMEAFGVGASTCGHLPVFSGRRRST